MTRGFDDEEQNAASLYELDVPETNTDEHSHVNSDLANAASLHEFEVHEANTEQHSHVNSDLVMANEAHAQRGESLTQQTADLTRAVDAAHAQETAAVGTAV